MPPIARNFFGPAQGWSGGDELDVILSFRGAMRLPHKVLTIKFDEKRTWES